MAILEQETGELHNEGCVVDTFSRTEKIMSDVWATITYAVVYEPTGEHTGFRSTETDWSGDRDEDGNLPQKPKGPCQTFRNVVVYNDEFYPKEGKRIIATVDGTPEALAAYEGWKAGRELASRIRDRERREYEALQRRREVCRDKWVRVVSGRKVKHGTEGIVFWTQEQSYYGRRAVKIGIGIPQADGTFRKTTRLKRNGDTYESYKDVKWTYASNVVVISGHKGRKL